MDYGGHVPPTCHSNLTKNPEKGVLLAHLLEVEMKVLNG